MRAMKMIGDDRQSGKGMSTNAQASGIYEILHTYEAMSNRIFL
jgi:hypothetical protein